MIVTVHYLDNEFVAYDESGQKVTNRQILEQLSFEQFPAFKGVLTYKVQTDQAPQQVDPLDIKLNLDKP